MSAAKISVAKKAINQIEKKFTRDMVLGIGTGSTVNFFIEELSKYKNHFYGAVSSSEASTKLLKAIGIDVFSLNDVNEVSFYIDGADEVSPNNHLIKGGGGAHTNEKKLAKQANEFICIIDDQKLVNCLGDFPLPVEVKIAEANKVIPVLKQFSNNISKRENLSDSGNYLYDIHNFKIENPNKIEEQILSINGIVDVGIFSINKPSTVVVGLESTYKLIES